MPDCELLATCPYFNGDFQEGPGLTERLKEEYCRGEYEWCGRYMTFKALQREMELVKNAVTLVSHSNVDEKE